MSGTRTYGVWSDWLEGRVLGNAFLGESNAMPAAVYVALFRTPPTDLVPGEEPTNAARYTRLLVTLERTAEGDDGSTLLWNVAALQWPMAAMPWGTLSHVGLFDAAIFGNYLAWAPMETPRTVNVGDAVRFDANTLLLGLR